MLFYSRIEVSEGNDVNKRSTSEECIICHYQFFNERFRFGPADGCHGILMMCIDINTVAVLNIYGVDFRSSITEVSKKEAITLLKMLIWVKKSGPIQNISFH